MTPLWMSAEIYSDEVVDASIKFRNSKIVTFFDLL